MSGGRGHALAGVRVQKGQMVQRFDTSSSVRVVVGVCGASINAAAEAGALWTLSMVPQFHHAKNRTSLCGFFMLCFFYSSGRIFLLSGPGVVTTIFSGVMMTAPLVVQAPWKSASAMALNFSTTGPSVT